MKETVMRLAYPGALRLPELYIVNGLEQVAWEIFGVGMLPQWRDSLTTMLVSSFAPIALSIFVADDKDPLTKEKADELLKQSLEEIKSGDIHVYSEMHLIIGRKPLGTT
jgi:hypothetical protein